MAGGAAVIAALRAAALLQGADSCHRRRAGDREHARRPRDQAGRRAARRGRQDRGSREHRRRRPADSGRRPLVCARAGRHAPGRHRDADRRVRRRARARMHSGIFGTPGCVRRRGPPPRPRDRRSLLAHAVYRRLLRAVEERRRRHEQHRRPPRRRGHRGGVPEAVRWRLAVGAPRHRRHRLGRRGAARGRSRAPPAWPSALLAELALDPESWRTYRGKLEAW